MAGVAKTIRRFTNASTLPMAVGLGGGFALSAYAGLRCLACNPEVVLSKARRQNHLADSPIQLELSERYKKSIFRSAGRAYGRKDIFPNETIVRAMK